MDKHHIFPDAYLKQQGEPRDRRNIVSNITYIREDSNQAIGKLAPSIYLRESEKLGHNVVELMRRHAIGPEALAAMRQDDYGAFINARAKYLAATAELLVQGETTVDEAVLRVTS